MPYIPPKENTPEQTEEVEKAVVTKTESKPSKAKESEECATETAKKAIEDTGDEPETSASGAETIESTSEAACAETKAGTLKRGRSAEDKSSYNAEFEELKARLKAHRTLRTIRRKHSSPSGICLETEEPIAYLFGLNSPGLIAIHKGDHVSQEL